MQLRLLQLYVFLIPFERLWTEVFNSDTIFKPYRLVSFGVVGLAVLKRRKRGLRFDFFDKGLIAILAWGAIMAAFWYIAAGTGRLELTGRSMLLIFFSFAVYIVIKNDASSPRQLKSLLQWYVFGLVTSVVLHQLFFAAGTGVRYSAFFKNPNALAMGLAGAIQFVLAFALFDKRGGTGTLILGGTLIALMIGTLLTTGSRAGLVAFALGTLAFVIPLTLRAQGTSSRFARSSLRVLPVALLIAAALSVTLSMQEAPEAAMSRYDIKADDTGAGRSDIWRGALNVALDHYLIGIGTTQYPTYHRRAMAELGHLDRPGMKDKELVVHSQYLDFLTSQGAGALLLYLWMLAVLYKKVKRHLGAASHISSIAAVALPFWTMILLMQIGHTMIASPLFYFYMAVITSVAGASAPATSRSSVKRPRLETGLREVATT